MVWFKTLAILIFLALITACEVEVNVPTAMMPPEFGLPETEAFMQSLDLEEFNRVAVITFPEAAGRTRYNFNAVKLSAIVEQSDRIFIKVRVEAEDGFDEKVALANQLADWIENEAVRYQGESGSSH